MPMTMIISIGPRLNMPVTPLMGLEIFLSKLA